MTWWKGHSAHLSFERTKPRLHDEGVTKREFLVTEVQSRLKSFWSEGLSFRFVLTWLKLECNFRPLELTSLRARMESIRMALVTFERQRLKV